MKSCCGSSAPRLMPNGMGSHNTQQTCYAPCTAKPCNISMKHPVCDYPVKTEEKRCKSPRARNIPQCSLAPINVNLKMCKQPPPSRQSDYQDCQPQQAYYGYPKESFGCFNEEPEQPPRRCPDGNFVVKVESLKPASEFQASSAPFYGKTTYNSSYEAKALDKVNPYKPKTTFMKSLEPLDGVSLYKSEFVAYETMPYKRPEWAKAADFHPPEGSMLDARQTTYNSAYTGCAGGPAASSKPQRGYKPSRDPFDGSTTHKVDYIPFCNFERSRSYKPSAEDADMFPCVKFRGDTTYHSDFTPKCMEVRQSFKGRGVPLRTGKFSGETTYSVAYEPFYYVKCEPCIPGEIYDQMYPRNPCDCVSCCAPANRNDGPPVPPSPPCPMPQLGPCEQQAANCEPAYKLTVKNENCHFEPTVYSIQPNPNCTPQLNF